MAHFVLDVNETLSDMTPVADVLQQHGAPAELARTWFASVLRDGFALSLQGRAPAFPDLGRDVLRACLADVRRLDAPVEQVIEQVVATLGELEVHPDVVPGITALTDAGHAVSLLTNGAAASAARLIERAGVRDRVRHVLSVEDGTGRAGAVWKPHLAAYARAAVAIGAPAETLTMVAVHPWDLDGAAAAGLSTVWIDRHGTPWPRSFRAPGLRVGSLTELAERTGLLPQEE